MDRRETDGQEAHLDGTGNVEHERGSEGSEFPELPRRDPKGKQRRARVGRAAGGVALAVLEVLTKGSHVR